MSVVVPCRNERAHIETCVLSILEQVPPPGDFEVIVVDGHSDDGTREVLARLEEAHARLRVIDNPDRITPAAMNRGIRAARGAFVAIFGAHTRYGEDYLLACSQLLAEHPEADCVGGPIESAGNGAFGQAVAAAMSHPAGVGNAHHRFPDYEGYAEGACFPVFRREVFDRIGFYDEDLVRNQDDELNFRLKQAGGRVFISPRARSVYFVRDRMATLFRQYFLYGYWRPAVLRKHRRPASFRQLAPSGLLLLLIVSCVTAVVLPSPWSHVAWLVPTSYSGVVLIIAATRVTQAGWRTSLWIPAAIAIMHLSYAAGFFAGLFKHAEVTPK
jgi:glycosyltransferase involved in cell wall biosynthesis